MSSGDACQSAPGSHTAWQRAIIRVAAVLIVVGAYTIGVLHERSQRTALQPIAPASSGEPAGPPTTMPPLLLARLALADAQAAVAQHEPDRAYVSLTQATKRFEQVASADLGLDPGQYGRLLKAVHTLDLDADSGWGPTQARLRKLVQLLDSFAPPPQELGRSGPS
jgi:hypothetical protein